MKVVAFICQKGGTGKTTLAVNHAVEAARSGLRTLIVDLDPQVSACKWQDFRDDKEIPAVMDAQAQRLPNLLKAAQETGVELVVVDTAGRTEEAAKIAARNADLVVIPMQPSIADLSTIDGTIGLLEIAGSPRRVAVMTRVKPYGSRLADMRRYLEDQGVPVASVTIGDRVGFQDAFALGLGIQELDPTGKGSEETRELYKYISIALENATTKGARREAGSDRKTA